MFSDNAFSGFTLMAMGISSYVGASIIIQLSSFIFPSLKRMHKSPGGAAKIKQYTTILGCVLSFFSSIGTTIIFNKQYGLLYNSAWYAFLIIALLHTLGTFFAIQIGNKIKTLDFGDGCSILIAANVVVSLYGISKQTVNAWFAKANMTDFYLLISGIFVLFLLCLLLETIVRHVPVQYTSVTTRNKGFNNELDFSYDIKLNISGVLPLIFAMSIFQGVNAFSSMLTDNLNFSNIIYKITSGNDIEHYFVLSLLIIIFSLMYTFLSFDVDEIGFDMQRKFASFPGVRPGKETQKLLRHIRRKHWLFSSIFLAFLCCASSIFFNKLGITEISAASIIVLVSVTSEMFSNIFADIKTSRILAKHLF